MTLIASGTHTLTVRSASFDHRQYIPAKYTCQGKNINPFINWDNLPHHTESIAIIMYDHDVPNGGFTHWIMWNIDPDQAIDENSAPGVQGKNSKGEIGYTGPCPPAGVHHHYHFRIYALDAMLDLEEGATKKELEYAIDHHLLAWGEVIGLYQKTQDPQLNVDVEPGGFR